MNVDKYKYGLTCKRSMFCQLLKLEESLDIIASLVKLINSGSPSFYEWDYVALYMACHENKELGVALPKNALQLMVLLVHEYVVVGFRVMESMGHDSDIWVAVPV